MRSPFNYAVNKAAKEVANKYARNRNGGNGPSGWNWIIWILILLFWFGVVGRIFN